MVALFQKRGKWWIDYYAEGRRVRECVGASKRMAERALDSRRGEIAQGRFKLAQVKRSPLFEAIADEYERWAEANTHAPAFLRVCLRPLRESFRGKRLRDITPWLVERYKQERRTAIAHPRRLGVMVAGGRAARARREPGPRRAIRPTTINRELACLRRLFNLALAWGKAESNPVRGVKFFREDGSRSRVLSPDEIGRLLAACGAGLRPIVVLALHTGMRRGEILGLTWDRVDLAGASVTLTRTKSGKRRVVPLNAVARAVLVTASRRGPYVFGGEKAYASIKTAFRAACRRAGLVGVLFHDLRHTWATYLVQETGDLRTVQELGGWCSLAMVERYSHPTPEAKRRAVAALPGFLAAGNGHQMDTTTPAAVAAPVVSMR